MKHNTQIRIYSCFVILGFGSFLTYYCMLAQTNYWARFYGKSAITIFNMAYSTSELLGGFLIVPLSKYVSTRQITVMAFTGSILCLLVTVPMIFVKSLVWRYIATLTPLVISGFIGSLFFSALIATSTKVGQIYSQAICMGVGLSSIAIQIAEDLVTAFCHVDQIENPSKYDKSLILNAIAYYALVICILAGCMYTWFRLEMLVPQITRKQVPLHAIQQDVIVAVENKKEEDSVSASNTLDTCETDPDAYLEGDVQTQSNTNNCNDNKPSNLHIQVQQKTPQKQILHNILPVASAICASFLVTIIFFPLFTMNIPCYTSYRKTNVYDNDWWRLTLLTVQNGFDFAGRLGPLFKKFTDKVKIKHVIILCYSRFIFGILMCAMVFPKPDLIANKFPLIKSDTFAIVTQILFAFSHSFCNVMALVKFQDLFTKNDEKETGSMYLNIFIECGQFVGGVTSLGMLSLFR